MIKVGKPQPRLVYAWEGQIEELQAEVERLRAAFSTFLEYTEKEFGYLPSGFGYPIKEAMLKARTALGEKP